MLRTDIAVPEDRSHRTMEIEVRRLDNGRLLFGPRDDKGQPCRSCVDARLASNGHRWRAGALGDVSSGLAARIADGLAGSTTPVGTVLSIAGEDIARHIVLPVPGCPCMAQWCAPNGLTLADAVDPLFGILSRVDSFGHPGPSGEPSRLALGRPCALPALGGLPTIIDGAGFGAPDTAFAAAVAETLERYCASFIPVDLPVCPPRDLGAEHLVPQTAPFAGEPIGWRQPVRWAAGRRLIDDAPCFVQASAIWFPYVCHDLEPRCSRGGSEGLAAGATRHDAVVHATHEVIERDSFVRAWRFGGPRRALPSPFDGPYDLRLVEIGNRFGLPVVAAFLESDDAPLCTAGISARGSLDEAVGVAAREAIGARALDLHVGRSHAGSIEARHRHARDPALRRVRDRWCEGAGPMRGPSPPADWAGLVLRLPDAVAVDVTTADVRALGLSVVRVVIPGCFASEPLAGENRIGGDPAPSPF